MIKPHLSTVSTCLTIASKIGWEPMTLSSREIVDHVEN